ncbi:MAG: class D sortase [Acidobacteria bacterium]|nr:class D sortase [Acidobacteriota bacterium]
MKSTLRLLAWVTQIGGALVVLYCAFVIVRAHAFQTYANWMFERARGSSRTGIQSYSPPSISLLRSNNRLAPGLPSLIGRIEIPRLRLSVMILEGDDERQLQLGAGHIPGTALPGESGNVVIAAHRDSFFQPLRDISKNDQIVVTTLNGSFQYRVDSVQVTDPDNRAVLRHSDEPVLTLVTCYPFTYIGSAPKRFIVQARRVEAADARGNPLRGSDY